MYLNLIEIAESFGVSEKVVEDWMREQGLPHTPDRGRLLFDRARVAHWAAAHGLAARAGFLAPERGPFGSGVPMESMLRAGGIWREGPGAGVTEVLDRILGSLPNLSQPVRALLGQRIHTRGGVNWAPVGNGYALPHFSARVTLGRGAGLVALLLLRDPLELGDAAVDSVPVERLFFFIPPSPRAHLDMLGRLSHAVRSQPLRGLVDRAAPDDELFQAMAVLDQSGRSGEERGNPS